jgi:hypothetical protein
MRLRLPTRRNTDTSGIYRRRSNNSPLPPSCEYPEFSTLYHGETAHRGPSFARHDTLQVQPLHRLEQRQAVLLDHHRPEHFPGLMQVPLVQP